METVKMLIGLAIFIAFVLFVLAPFIFIVIPTVIK